MPHLSRTANASRRSNYAIAKSGKPPSVTRARAKQALRDVLRMFADPVRAAALGFIFAAVFLIGCSTAPAPTGGFCPHGICRAGR